MSSVNSQTLALRIAAFGREIFREVARQRASIFSRRYWSDKLMLWSMANESFKVNLFRLVDVLPTLRTPEAVTAHLREYLAQPARELHPFLGWAVDTDIASRRARWAAFAVKKSVGTLAEQFIAGSSAENALKILRRLRKRGTAFTVDLLGEFSLSESEAGAYLERYLDVVRVLSREVPQWPESKPLVTNHPGEKSAVCISVKLTALYSQCSVLNFERSVSVLRERLSMIAREAKQAGAQIYVDAEDTANNPIIYETFKRVFVSPEFRDIPYPGIVIQAYLRDSAATVDDMLKYARRRGTPIAIRLVKGAYGDSETILSGQQGFQSPLWRSKQDTDANYEQLSRILLENHSVCLPAFGSHNIRSLSHACCYAESLGLTPKDFELQMLFGMADPIAAAFRKRGYLVRFYVPVGEILPGMGYLVRRLLENTSNESFLKHAFFKSTEIHELLREPTFTE